MKATVRLSEAEIVEACLKYISANGWAPAGRGRVELIRGSDDPREPGAPGTVAFVVDVQTPEPDKD